MNTNYFKTFIKRDNDNIVKNNEVWIYTRVSSKDQESNNSLQNQKENTEKYAKEHGYFVSKSFGHTYESAKKDFTRKEFKSLIQEIRKARKKPYAILIYIMSRFSRSGGSGIGIVNEFRELGVHIIETYSGISTESEIGEFQVYQKLLDARKENIDRLKSTMPGLKRFVENGNYLGTIPRGYTLYGTRTSDFKYREQKQRIEINEEGKQLAKAWKWKASGERDYMIIDKLSKLGVDISKQTLSAIWRNPTYCGVSTNKLLEKPIKGNWKAIVSEKIFMKVQDILSKNKSGYKVDKTNESRPLTKHLICSECGRSMTGYEVKKKGVHYYKCQKCKNATVNAETTKRSIHKGIHDTYTELLENYKLEDDITSLVIEQLNYTFSNLNDEDVDSEKSLKEKLKRLKEKESKLTDKLLEDIISDIVYKKSKTKIDNEINNISMELNKMKNKISNLNNFIEKSIEISNNLSKQWASGNYNTKIKIQDLVFPEGVVLNTKKRQYLTKKINSIFFCIEDIARETRGQKKDFPEKISEKSCLVAGTGLEPATYGL